MDKELLGEHMAGRGVVIVMGCTSFELKRQMIQLAIEKEFEQQFASFTAEYEELPFREFPPIELEMITRSFECEPIILAPKLKHISRELKTKTGYTHENTNRKFRNYTGKRC